MDKRDYEEPRCPMDNSMWVKNKVVSIPTDRIIAKEDEYLSKNDYISAERHLLYWMSEAINGNDKRGMLVLCNELMGLYRKTLKQDEAINFANKAIKIVDELEMKETISGATAYLNAATVYKAFNNPLKSLELFESAKLIYENKLENNSDRLAGLYNNMALTLADLNRFDEAKEYYNLALNIKLETNKADAAITYLNIADLLVKKNGIKESLTEIHECLENAKFLIDSIDEIDRDSYYAYVCEKCAPVFKYYHYYIYSERLEERSKQIYKIYQNKEEK